MRVLTPALLTVTWHFTHGSGQTFRSTPFWQCAARRSHSTRALLSSDASRGHALHVSGRHEEAVAEFEQALALDPNLHEANFFYGRLCYTRGDFESAARLV